MQLITLLNTHTHTLTSHFAWRCVCEEMPEKRFIIYVLWEFDHCVYVLFFGACMQFFLWGGVGLAYMLAWHTKQMKVWIWFCCCMPLFFFFVFVLLAFYSKLFNLFLSLFDLAAPLGLFLGPPFEWMNLIMCWMGLSYEDYFGS